MDILFENFKQTKLLPSVFFRMVAEDCHSEKKQKQKKVICVLEKFCIIRYKKNY